MTRELRLSDFFFFLTFGCCMKYRLYGSKGKNWKINLEAVVKIQKVVAWTPVIAVERVRGNQVIDAF